MSTATLRSVCLCAMVLLLPACGPAPRDDRSIAIALESAPLTLDPRDTTNTDTAHVQQLIFNTLVTKGPDYDFAPELALSWQASSDLLEYTFRLRPGVRFHDGHELTGRDVAHTFNSLVAGGYGKSPAFSALDRVEVDDPLTVRFVCRRPNPGLLVDLVAVGIVAESAGGETGRAPIGTGPFRAPHRYAGEGDLRLEAFDGYFGGRPAIDGLDLRVIPDAATRGAAIAAGEVDLTVNPGLAPDAIARFGGKAGQVRVVAGPGGGVQFVVLNTEARGLADVRVRHALALGLDRASIVEALAGGRARIAASPLPPDHWAVDGAAPVAYDPGAARRLVEEAGAVGARVELMVLPSTADRDLAAVLQEAWRALGVEVEVVPVERAVFLERLAKGDFAAALHRFTGGNQFTAIFKGAFHSRSIHAGARGELNFARLSDPQLDRMIDEADLTGDRAARIRLYGEIQRRVAELAPWILLWHPDTVAVAGPRVGPFVADRSGDFYFVRSLTLAK